MQTNPPNPILPPRTPSIVASSYNHNLVTIIPPSLHPLFPHRYALSTLLLPSSFSPPAQRQPHEKKLHLHTHILAYPYDRTTLFSTLTQLEECSTVMAPPKKAYIINSLLQCPAVRPDELGSIFVYLSIDGTLIVLRLGGWRRYCFAVRGWGFFPVLL